MKKRLLSCLVLLVLIVNGVVAQTAERPFSLGVWGGLTQYNGDLGQGFYDFSQAKYVHAGLNASWYVNPHFDFVMNATYGEIGHVENPIKHFRGEQIQGNIHFNYNILNSDKNKIIPYLLGGIGAQYLSRYSIVKGVDFFSIFGAGVRFKLNDRINLHIQESFAYTDHDDRDGEVRNNNDGFMMHSIGLTYSFSGGKDSDNDGVNDKRDNCPNTPPGVKVDEKGCPLDRDGDGIADYLDVCPDVKGTIALKGCPDRDNDGVVDSLDKCPDVAGTMALKGCPDKDADGITDAEDKCPDVFGVVALQGCPITDTDSDGISDTDDACPTEKGMVSAKGCPDKDGDSVVDKDDKCPDVAGVVLNFGCPETKPETTAVTPEAIKGIMFETGSDNLTKASYSTLKNVISLLKTHPEYKIYIEGHTDNTGTESGNEILSQKRADIVKVYLEGKGINKNRISTKGYGQTQPIGDNTTEEGRAKNRRVEFKVQ